jgi:hypothetical protein
LGWCHFGIALARFEQQEGTSMEFTFNHVTEEQLSFLFQPDTLLSDQYTAVHRRASHLEPEKHLMLAVLQDAIDCFQKYLRAQDKKGKSLFQEAEEWIFEKDADWFFSFENVCEMLGLHPEFLRRGLEGWKKAQLNGGRNGSTGGSFRKRRGHRRQTRLPSAA